MNEDPNEVEQYRNEARRAATSLRYGLAAQTCLKNAKTIGEISRIMASFRKKKMLEDELIDI